MESIFSRLKIPALIAAGILGLSFFLRSSSYITPDNIKQTMPLKAQRLSNLKQAVILAFAVFVVVAVVHKRKEEDERISIGTAPF